MNDEVKTTENQEVEQGATPRILISRLELDEHLGILKYLITSHSTFLVTEGCEESEFYYLTHMNALKNFESLFKKSNSTK
jgi:hypothetical protein